MGCEEGEHNAGASADLSDEWCGSVVREAGGEKAGFVVGGEGVEKEEGVFGWLVDGIEGDMGCGRSWKHTVDEAV